MFLRLAPALAALLLLQAPPLAAQDSAPAPDKPEIKCKKTRKTGSRVPVKVCMPVEEWERVSEQGKKDIDEIRSTSTINLERSG